MIRHYQVRVVADFEMAVVGEMARALEVGDFREQRQRIDDQSVTNNADLAGIERAGRDQGQPDFFSADHQRMCSVVAALEADDNVGVGGEHIDYFALALVPPLRADHGHCLHFSPLRARRFLRTHARAPIGPNRPMRTVATLRQSLSNDAAVIAGSVFSLSRTAPGTGSPTSKTLRRVPPLRSRPKSSRPIVLSSF